MDERDPRADLRDLELGLERARRAREGGASRRGGGTGWGQEALGPAFRIGLELVVAVGVGVGVGWIFDHVLGTRPWGMIGFFFLGVAAGLVNVYRTLMGMGMAIGYRRGSPPVEGGGYKDDDED